MAGEPTMTMQPWRQDAGPSAPTSTADGATQTASSFGLANTTVGPDYDAAGMLHCERVVELEYRASFYYARQHDWKIFDFAGRMVRPGKINATQPLIGGSMPSFYVPLDQRRPSTPYRLARKIVAAFTGMLFGHGRWPQIRSDDPDTQDFVEALVKACTLEAKMIRARNIGGACGTVGLSWAFFEGEPRVQVHAGSRIHVLEWEDEEERVPAHVSKLTQVAREVWDPDKKQRVRKLFWKRRDWTREADVEFKEVEVKLKQDPWWAIDQERTCRHGDGFCHFVWVENLVDDETEGGMDGLPDYSETYEAMNTLDTINSVIDRGAALNLDPTLCIQTDNDVMSGKMLRKGSDNALFTGANVQANYLELEGTSITTGSALVKDKKGQILETCECVVPDPDQVAAAGLSSVAMKMLYAPMLVKTDTQRYQYGQAVERLLGQMHRSAKAQMPNLKAQTDNEKYLHLVPDGAPEGTEPEPVEYTLALPPRIDQKPVLDERGEPTGEFTEEVIERTPGEGRIWLEWGPYFKPTAKDVQEYTYGMTTANGNKPVLSQQTCVELSANLLDRDGVEEWKKVQEEQRQQARQDALQQQAMYVGIGGEVPPGGGEAAPGTLGLPSGGEPPETALPAPDGAPSAGAEGSQPAGVLAPQATGQTTDLELAPTDIGKVVLVNEARERMGLGLLMNPETGRPDPDGNLTIAEFTAKREAMAGAEAKVAEKQGTAGIDAAQAKLEAALKPKTQEVPAAPAPHLGSPSPTPPAGAVVPPATKPKE